VTTLLASMTSTIRFTSGITKEPIVNSSYQIFDEFLKALKPNHSRPLHFEPGQIEKVWVDPGFLKSLKKEKP